MANPTDSEIVFTHIKSNPQVFLEVLRESPVEQKETILAYLQTLPEIGNEQEQTNQSEEGN
jgi:hypothetical protein